VFNNGELISSLMGRSSSEQPPLKRTGTTGTSTAASGGTDTIRPTDQPKVSDIYMVRPYSNLDI
jgi:hypothetical protein